MARDPYRILGLLPGAPAADVKRAYRRLAKEHHPDSAGESALPRFLEIQRAYEQLVSAPWRPGTRRPAPTEPWRADPARARSTPGATGAHGAGAAGTSGAEAGATGASGRAAGGRGTAGGRSTRPGHATGDRSGAGAGPRGGGARPGPGSDGSTGRRRGSRKATFGSTTYDEAREQADPTWSGASWYGPSSGEYWQVNPREYADPRKHGPEYQARAAARAAAAAERRTGAADSAASRRPSWTSPPGSVPDAPPPNAPAPDAAAPDTPPPDAPPPNAAAAEAVDAAAQAAPDLRSGGPTSGDRPAAGSPVRARLARALVAWPPLGIAAAVVIGEVTGCASFLTSCTSPGQVYPWLTQAAILLVLLALPSVARILAGGTAAVALVAFPAVAILSAGGAGYDREHGPATLMAVLAVAWAVGVGAAIVRRTVPRASPRVRP